MSKYSEEAADAARASMEIRAANRESSASTYDTVARRPEIFQEPTEKCIMQIIEEATWGDTWVEQLIEPDKIAKRIFEEIIAPLHRQWADQLRVESQRR